MDFNETPDYSDDSLEASILGAMDETTKEPENDLLDDAISKALDSDERADDKANEKDDESKFNVEEEKESDGEEVKDDSPKQSTLTAPTSWTAKAKAKFDALPDEVKAEVHKREQDFFNGIEKYKGDAEIGQRMQKVLSPYEPIIKAQGLQSEQIVGDMLNAAYRLTQGTPQDKAKFVLEIAQQYGADLQSLITSGNNSEEVQPKNEYVSRLEQEVNSLKQYLQNQAQSAQQREYDEAVQSVESFKNEMENGKPKYPFFENVRETMSVLVQASGGKLSLKDAYEQAVRANPETFALWSESQQAERKAKEDAERARIAAQARKKAGINVKTGGKPTSTPQKNVSSLDETISSILDDLAG